MRRETKTRSVMLQKKHPILSYLIKTEIKIRCLCLYITVGKYFFCQIVSAAFLHNFDCYYKKWVPCSTLYFVFWIIYQIDILRVRHNKYHKYDINSLDVQNLNIIDENGKVMTISFAFIWFWIDFFLNHLRKLFRISQA